MSFSASQFYTLLPLAVIVLIAVGAYLGASAWVKAFHRAEAKAKAEGKIVDLVCKTCGTKGPATRQPASWREYLHGGWTCAHCLTTVDRYGIAIPGISGRPASKPVAPWLRIVGKYRFLFMAVFWGFFMWLFFTAGVMIDFLQGKGFDIQRIVLGAVVFAGGGSLFGLFMWLTQRKRGEQKKAEDTSKHF